MADSTEELIARLASDVKPVKRLLSPMGRTFLWTAVATIYVGAMSAAPMAHPALASMIGLVMWQNAAACVIAFAAAYAAFLSVVPGQRAAGVLLVFGIALAAWIVILTFASTAEWQAGADLARESDWPCVMSMLVGGAALVSLLIVMLRRGAPLAPGRALTLAATAAAAVGSIEACVARPHAFMTTILMWHGTAAVVLVLVVVATARPFLTGRIARHP